MIYLILAKRVLKTNDRQWCHRYHSGRPEDEELIVTLPGIAVSSVVRSLSMKDSNAESWRSCASAAATFLLGFS